MPLSEFLIGPESLDTILTGFHSVPPYDKFAQHLGSEAQAELFSVRIPLRASVSPAKRVVNLG
jgi:hypothetical protein